MLTFATHPSALARQQTAHVIRLLQIQYPGLVCEMSIFPTVSDRGPDLSYSEIVNEELSTRELEEALHSGKANVSVHSLNALPVEDTPGLVIGAIPERGVVDDVLVTADGRKLMDLTGSAYIGTSSLRRTAQLLAYRPDLNILPLHGDVDSSLNKVSNGDYDGVVLARAELTHLGLESHISEIFPLDVMLPAPGQGALAVQCRADDMETRAFLTSIHDPLTTASVEAERAFLGGLGGGTSLPIAAFAQKADGKIILTGAVISPDGKQAIRLSAVDQDPHKLGKWLADLVLERGAAGLLKAVA